MPCQFISLKFNIAGLWSEFRFFTSGADAESQIEVVGGHSCMQVWDDAQVGPVCGWLDKQVYIILFTYLIFT